MAFTEEEIWNALNGQHQSGVTLYYRDPSSFKESQIYHPVMDFLTGKSNSLPSMKVDNLYYPVNQLLNLLTDIEKPTANNHLVVKVITHPDLYNFTSEYYIYWLIKYMVESKGQKALQAAVTHLRGIGINDDFIAGNIVNLGFQTESKLNFEGTAAWEFLVNYIKTSRQFVFPTSGSRFRRDEWSMQYFKLLEDLRPEFADEYAVYCIYHSDDQFVQYFDEYRNGFYMLSILPFLKDWNKLGLRQIEVKYEAILGLYEKNPGKYSAVAVELSYRYLQFLAENFPKETWNYGGGVHLKIFENTDLDYTPYSSAAWYVLFTEELEKGLELLRQIQEKKVYTNIVSFKVLFHFLEKDAFPYIEKDILENTSTIDHNRKAIELLKSQFEPSRYLPVLWKLAGIKSKAIKILVANIVVETDSEAEKKAIELLGNKNAEVRQTAAMVLTQLSSVAAETAVANALHKEINDNARDILLQSLGPKLPQETTDEFISQTVIAAKERGKLNKPVESWLSEELLPPLYSRSGKKLDDLYVRFLLYRMSRVKEMRSDIEANYIIQTLDREKSAPFATHLINTYLENEAKPDQKYLLALAALVGNDTIVDKIRTTLNRWMEEARHKMSEYAIGALALHGSDKALRWVEWYSRKFKNKKANVGAAAQAALETAAEELGISTHELGDRIVPDFGFEGLFKHFKIGDEEYRAFIDSNFKIAFFNENDKKLKALPAGADAELKDEFKQIGKEVRDIVRSQSSRLEYYLIIQRRWTLAQWKKFFLQNPVMFIYATKLLWGQYSKSGELVTTFICQEDTSLVDINSEEITPDPEMEIGIVHPTQLSVDQLKKLKQLFFDLSIESIFPQLERRIPELKDIDLSKKIINKFNEKETATGSIRSTLERYGWHKGPTGDGGMIYSFHLRGPGEMEAMLEVEGVGAGFGWGNQEKTGRLYIIDKSKIKQRWFNPPQDDNDERLKGLKDIPPIFLNEMLAAIEMIKPKEKAETT